MLLADDSSVLLVRCQLLFCCCCCCCYSTAAGGAATPLLLVLLLHCYWCCYSTAAVLLVPALAFREQWCHVVLNTHPQAKQWLQQEWCTTDGVQVRQMLTARRGQRPAGDTTTLQLATPMFISQHSCLKSISCVFLDIVSQIVSMLF